MTAAGQGGSGTNERDPRLADPEPAVRYAACEELRSAAEISAADARALLALLLDPAQVEQWFTDPAGDPGCYTPSVGEAAASALDRHGQAHRDLLEEAIRTGDDRTRAAVARVLPKEAPWTELLRALDSEAIEVRRAALERLGKVVTTIPDASQLDRWAPVCRALIVASLDPDRTTALVATRALPPPRSDDRPLSPMQDCCRLAASRIAHEEPQIVARLLERLVEAEPVLSEEIATVLGWCEGIGHVADALATKLIARPDRLVLWTPSLARIGPVLSPGVLDELVGAYARGHFESPRGVPPLFLGILAEYGPRAGAAAPRMLDWLERHGHVAFNDLRSLNMPARSLGRLGESTWALKDRLVSLLRGPNPLLGGIAAMVLGELYDHAGEIVPWLAECLRGPRDLRMLGALHAATSLGRRARALVPDIAPILEPDPSPGSRYTREIHVAACQLAKALGRDAIELAPAVLRLVEDRSVQLEAIAALEALAPLPEELRPLGERVCAKLSGRSYQRLTALLTRS